MTSSALHRPARPGSEGPRAAGGRGARELLAHLTGPGRDDRLTHLEVLPARRAVPADWPDWADERVRAAYVARGVATPWRHQVTAAQAAWEGRHVVVATGTASGKSLAYQLPALTAVFATRGRRGQRGATTLYVSPTKALAQDQLAALEGLARAAEADGGPRLDVRATTHDGDSPRDHRDWARDHADYVLTNPDMLHRSLLGDHARWARFLGSLRFVVVDECHHYRGVFGAHVAHVLRRLRRLAALYGAEPTFVLASATVADPATSGCRLTGLPMEAVTDDASPRGQVAVALWEPPLGAHTGENGAPVRRGAGPETADLLADLVAADVATLAFVRSRQGAEQVAATAADLLGEVHPSLPARVASYRGGYLPEERREIEAALRSGALRGLAATNALELGIDVAGLDAVLVAGFPGTRAAFWQQVGRAGRGAGDALGVLVARDDPLDTYLVTHPEALLGRPVEAFVFDPSNPYVLGPQLAAAADELPLTAPDLELFGEGSRDAVRRLVEAGLLRRRPRGWFWRGRPADGRACDLADLRSTGGAAISLVEADTGRVVGTVDGDRAHGTVHPGAVYVHRGERWLVERLDLDEHVAVMERADPPYTTSAREVTDIRVVSEATADAWGPCRIAHGEVEVSHQVVAFLRRRRPGGEVIGEEPLDLPVRTIRTHAVWWTVPDDALVAAGIAPADRPGAAHAAEHCSIGLLPLFATCDRWDIGGVSTALHPDTGELTVFVHDGRPGGAGFAEHGYAVARAWLTATRETILACRCDTGCPSCVQSPKCGNQNNPLDKAGAARLLGVLLAQDAAGGTRSR